MSSEASPILDDVQIDDAVVQKAFDRYMAMRADLGRENKPRCMMDLATIGAKELKKQGILKNLDESDEINACTVKIKCDVNGKDEDWLFLFKNETHNHPTEIEPFGGAATCIGGAIRDPSVGWLWVSFLKRNSQSCNSPSTSHLILTVQALISSLSSRFCRMPRCFRSSTRWKPARPAWTPAIP